MQQENTFVYPGSAAHLPWQETSPDGRLVVEEMHKIHKDVPFGYWVVWVEPAYRALKRRWSARRAAKAQHTGHDQLIALR
jgi:hypothetical protein